MGAARLRKSWRACCSHSPIAGKWIFQVPRQSPMPALSNRRPASCSCSSRSTCSAPSVRAVQENQRGRTAAGVEKKKKKKKPTSPSRRWPVPMLGRPRERFSTAHPACKTRPRDIPQHLALYGPAIIGVSLASYLVLRIFRAGGARWLNPIRDEHRHPHHWACCSPPWPFSLRLNANQGSARGMPRYEPSARLTPPRKRR